MLEKYRFIYLLMPLFFVSIVTIAQETHQQQIIVPLTQPENSGRLVVKQVSGSISVTGHSGKDVVIKASLRQHSFGKTTDTGLKQIPNSSLKLKVEEEANTVKVINLQSNWIIDLEIKVPYVFSLYLNTVDDGDIKVSNINGEFEISNVNGGITILNASGSASANTTNGNIKGHFKEISEGINMAFSTFEGSIDVSFPPTLMADVIMSSEKGEILTDFDLELQDQVEPAFKIKKGVKNYKAKIEQWTKGKINGGGPEIHFNTYNGNITIRSNKK